MFVWCWHRWGKWEPYVWQGEVKWRGRVPSLDWEWEEVTEERQRRTCEKCGLVQDREVKK